MSAPGDDHMKSPRYEDPSAKLWYSYLTEAEKHDRALAHSWKGDMDAILIFAGLFSASVTAFIIESYKSLLPNTDDKVILLLTRISDQLVSVSNGSHPASIPDLLDAKFTPAASALVCNTLWFLSLGFSLICALSATLVQQWTRNYIQATENRSTPQRRARISAFLYQGLNRFKMAALVEIIPLLLHISLLLFLAGLFAYLLSVNDALAYLILTITVLCSALYALITFLPVFHYDCPYHTPLSLLSWRILCSLRLLRQRDSLGVLQPIVCGMSEARESAAVELSSERDTRDFDAMCWAIELLRVDSELEPFIEVIPNVVACTDLSAKLLLYRLLNHDAVTIRLGYRIQRLLVTCTQGELAPATAQKRAITCLSAIWSLTMMSLPASPVTTTSTAYRSRETLHFDEQTLKYINLMQSGIPSVSDYSVSALTVVSRSLLDMYVDQILKLETEIGGFVMTRKWYHRNPGHDADLAHRHSDLVLKRLHQQLDELEAHLSCSHQEFALPCTTMETVHRHLEELVDIAASTPNIRIVENLVELGFEFIHRFRHALNQAGFSLTTEFIAYLPKSPSLPYEASNTLRRLFLAIDYDIPLSVESQSLFVDQLDEALEPHPLPRGSRLPESITNILQGMVPAVSDASCKLKAMRSIHLHRKRFPSNDAASKALVHLQGDHLAHSSSPPPLDLFGSHMYTNIKLDKTVTWTARLSGGTRDGAGLDVVLQGPSITR
ncbi:uncharacterized protein ARMOST_09758 [Armillaria ostoyae]|uniref:DUF6535 domain-containing protein n=1 Tax=Armillaria ostoyae TaxID=47428 RepID=A0A284RCC2_ARMOS|nr:uncharacterized protein ARMOST_09758 [Armillaria ostoyae]